MAYGRRASFGRRRRSMAPIINSIKNQDVVAFGISSTRVTKIFAKAVNSPVSTVSTDVSQGCVIKAVYIILDVCGLGGTGVLNTCAIYLMKNPGNNLVNPSPFSVGTSNEKKFVFRQWHYMIMRNQDGNNPNHWEGWIRIPKRYQRMGTDDVLSLTYETTAAVTGHASQMTIYKWYR